MLIHVYSVLLDSYGQQGWWPLLSCKNTEGFDEKGYHPGLFPELSFGQRFEIAVGAVLTQNTAWINVERSLLGLEGFLTPERILSLPIVELENRVKASGYFRQKAKKLITLSQFFYERTDRESQEAPARDSLLSLWGVGPETADSILLYAFGVPVFMIDAYTRRIFSRLGLVSATQAYEELREGFEAALEPDYRLYQEYHALIVRHAKEFCRSLPLCSGCPLSATCKGRVASITSE